MRKRSYMSFTLGKNNIAHGLILAPMAGVTDPSFRSLCRRFGAEYTVSEMVCAKALCYEQSKKKIDGDSKSGSLAHITSEELPMAIQIFGSEPEYMARAASMIAECSYNGCQSVVPPTAIDINMGCPVRKIVSNGEGSALMRNPSLCGKIVKAVAGAVSIPVTVKIRAGWDNSSKNAPEIARYVEDAGASAVVVHARTREQLYSPGIDREIIAKVKDAVRIPVIGNGDIRTADDALKMIRETGCDGIMIGRGALGAPWIFSEIRSALDGVSAYSEPSVREKLKIAGELLRMMVENKGERVGTAEAKKQVAWFISGIRGAAEARLAIMNAGSSSEILSVLDELCVSAED